jgi:hypothetical protein
MGVDTYVAEGPDETMLSAAHFAAFERLDLPLCEWCASGGEVSFRGRQYALLALEISSYGFAYDYLPPAAVREMALDFARCDPETVVGAWSGGRAPTVNEILALRRLLALCAELGLGLQGM